jgi:hypothetical protein
MFQVKLSATQQGQQSRQLYMQNQHVQDVNGFIRGLNSFARAVGSRYSEYLPPNPHQDVGSLVWTENIGPQAAERHAPLTLFYTCSDWNRSVSMTLTITNMT